MFLDLPLQCLDAILKFVHVDQEGLDNCEVHASDANWRIDFAKVSTASALYVSHVSIQFSYE
jgi:hypothetical protein